MRLKETIEELKEVEKYFEDMTDGSCPMCILEAIEHLELKLKEGGAKNGN